MLEALSGRLYPPLHHCQSTYIPLYKNLSCTIAGVWAVFQYRSWSYCIFETLFQD
jgi:hypothetical protein